ncbi:MAG: superoxide dismutase, Fe-Mn family, partial [Actinomycetota bacterium]|nr:superoxide dismutase, Fe-Mn family [Actinomycetota bacterium]
MAGHTLPDLPYAYDALEPHVDARALKLHHRRIHQGHVDRLNAVLGQLDPSLQELPVDELLRHIDEVPEDSRSAVRNHGGGHANHSLLWASLAPGGSGAPSGALGQA